MGERGMADMSEMEMPIPDNTLPMMSGAGPFGPMEMGGMFTVVKVRAEQRSGDYTNPGWYRHRKGEVAYEWTGPVAEAPRAPTQGGTAAAPLKTSPSEVELRARKPAGGR